MAANPLSSYFRQPAIYLKLPSQGRYWPDESLDLPVNGEIPVFPMTARDEILLRTPDALANGSGVVELIKSCCPNIIDPWKMPGCDVDAVIIGIRIASYGQIMDFDSACPHCGHDNTHGVDLTTTLDNLKLADYQTPVSVEKLRIKVKPQQYFSVNQTGRINFEEQQLLKSINDLEDEEIKVQKFNEQLKRLVALNIQIVTDSTEYIETEHGQKVHSPEYIKEFYENADNRILKTVQNHLEKINKDAEVPAQQVQCEDCTKGYAVNVTFDYSNFFGKGF